MVVSASQMWLFAALFVLYNNKAIIFFGFGLFVGHNKQSLGNYDEYFISRRVNRLIKKIFGRLMDNENIICCQNTMKVVILLWDASFVFKSVSFTLNAPQTFHINNLIENFYGVESSLEHCPKRDLLIIQSNSVYEMLKKHWELVELSKQCTARKL